MGRGNYDEYYKEKLAEGLEYQDFVADVLYSRGVPLVSYSSKKYQYSQGENKAGIEIKYDGRLSETGNIYIETHEKAHPDNPVFVESGMLRHDNSWLYAIGNYEVLYIFAIKTLKRLSGLSKFRRVSIPTSKGFLVSKKDAEKYAIRVVDFQDIKKETT